MNKDMLTDGIHTALNREYIKRLLIRYFSNKGFSESFNRKIYPPMIQDLLVQVPQLFGKVDIVPFVENIDPNTGVVDLGWNLFVLGNRRIYLGESTHSSLTEVRMSISGPLDGTIRPISAATPKRIVNFITNVLCSSRHGDITTIPKNVVLRTPALAAQNDPAGMYRGRGRPIY